MDSLLKEVRNCTICADFLPHTPRPVVSIHPGSKVLIIGQAPGSKVHASGIPWQDKSGENLRDWMGVSTEEFYNPELFGIIPMGFCYPGKGKSGDLPPRPECAPQWHEALINMMPDVQLTLLIGQYAQAYYLKGRKEKNLTETVLNFGNYLPWFMPLVHPSPRNQIWMKRNPWFISDLLPELKLLIRSIIN
ncbi:MAG: uracil-DNA glycosylase family protein [Bacteroidia bacterium]|nr:uracil-DNA glycosylase family protein [Bacteroidia bacterium]